MKPAAILSFQPIVNQTFEEASINAFIGAEAEPMYVGAPKMIASALANVSHEVSASATLMKCAVTPETLATPLLTASAMALVWP